MFVYIFFLGLIIGSFVNVVIHRVPLGQSIAEGRSRCPRCRAKLACYDLIPVVSFLILAGRCRSCNKNISPVYPVIELCSGLIFAVSLRLFTGSGWMAWVSAVFILELLLILAVIDWRHLILPDSLLIVLLAGAVAWSLVQKLTSSSGRWQIFDVSSLAGAGVLFVIFFLVWWLSHGRGLGFGDVKLVGIVGLIFGFLGGLVVLYLAVTAGAILGATLLLTHRADLKTKLPLGTLICASAAFYLLIGDIVFRGVEHWFYAIPLIFK